MSDFDVFRRKRKAYLEAALAAGHLKDEYQDEETAADPKYGRKMIRKLRNENGIADRIPADAPKYEDVFEGLLADDPGGRIIYEDYLNHLTVMVGLGEQETAERRASRNLIMEMIFRLYFKPGVDPAKRRSIVGAFQEYNYAVELKCRKISYIRTACMYYGLWLVRDIPVDRIIAEKIEELLNREVDFFDDDMPLNYIPGFNVPEAGGEINIEAEDYDSIIREMDVIRFYMLKHPQQIDIQCLMSVVTDNEELARISNRAALLDEKIDRYTITDAARGLDGSRWRKLFNGWIMVRTFCIVTGRILRFIEEYRYSLVGEATKALEKLLPEISYALVERNVRIAMRRVILEGSVYEFSLSEVSDSKPLKKTEGKTDCISLEAASEKQRDLLMEALEKDNRPIPVPGDFDLDDYLPDLSFICIKDKVPSGAVLVTEGTDGNLVLELVWAMDKTALSELICCAYEAAVFEYGKDVKLTVAVMRDRTAKLVESMVPTAVRQRQIIRLDNIL